MAITLVFRITRRSGGLLAGGSFQFSVFSFMLATLNVPLQPPDRYRREDGPAVAIDGLVVVVVAIHRIEPALERLSIRCVMAIALVLRSLRRGGSLLVDRDSGFNVRCEIAPS